MKIFTELYKNSRIIFRSLSSISMLILGPLILILIIGFAFSGDTMHDIKIGVHSNSYDQIGPMLDNLSSYSEIVRFSSLDKCLDSMKRTKVHICLDFGDGFMVQSGNDVPTGEIAFYFDNTRAKISGAIVASINEYLGLASDEISLRSTETIFNNIQKLVLYLNERKKDLDALKQESVGIRDKLVERKERLQQIYSVFSSSYTKVKNLQSQIDEKFSILSDAYNTTFHYRRMMNGTLDSISSEIENIGAILPYQEFYVININSSIIPVYNLSTVIPLLGGGLASQLSSTALTYYNLSDMTIIDLLNDTELVLYSSKLNSTISINVSELDEFQMITLRLAVAASNLESYREEIQRYDSSVDSLFILLNNTKREIDTTVYYLDQVNSFLVEEIELNTEAISAIDQGVTKINEITNYFDSEFENLNYLNPELAEKLVNPIVQTVNPLLENVRRIELVYPMLLSVVIIFISLLFSNIVSLQEINSKAFFRNLIAPVNDFVYSAGLIITSLLVVLLQVIILLLVGEYQFEIDVFSKLLFILPVIILLCLIFVFLGIIIAFTFKNQQTSVLVTTFVALGFFLFSDVVTPLEAMPKLASVIASYSPMVIATQAINQILVLDGVYFDISHYVTILAIYAVIVFVALFFITKYRNRNS